MRGIKNIASPKVHLQIRAYLLFLIFILFFNVVFAQTTPQTPTQQIYDRIKSLDDKFNTIIKSQLDFGKTISEDLNNTIKKEDINSMKDEINKKLDKKIEMPSLIIALILNDIFVLVFIFYLKAQGRL